MKKLFTLLFTVISTFALIGCNTVDGIGEDMEEAGENMQDAAN